MTAPVTKPARTIAGDIRPRRRPTVTGPRPATPRRALATASHPATAVSQPVAATPRPAITAPAAPAKPTKPSRAAQPLWRRSVVVLQYPLIAVVALSAAYSKLAGQVLFWAYVVIALAFCRSSRLTFELALMILASVLVFQVIAQPAIAQTAALYVFELLALASFQLWWESRKINKTAN